MLNPVQPLEYETGLFVGLINLSRISSEHFLEVLFTKRSVISVLNKYLLSEFCAERLNFLEGRSFTKLKDTS